LQTVQAGQIVTRPSASGLNRSVRAVVSPANPLRCGRPNSIGDELSQSFLQSPEPALGGHLLKSRPPPPMLESGNSLEIPSPSTSARRTAPRFRTGTRFFASA